MESSLTIGLVNHMKLRSEVRIDVDIKERRKPALLRAMFYTFYSRNTSKIVPLYFLQVS